MQSIKDFYKQLRPERFSDSSYEHEVLLPREQLDYILSQISINQKQDEFETLAKRFAERLIAPNLIPQVGPTGGGDGKTDFETHSVAEEIAFHWFTPSEYCSVGGKWAFAVSAKSDWLPKITSDVKKIVETQRGYDKIFFITNQKPSSKQKKDKQDSLKKEFGIDVEILDIKEKYGLLKVYFNVYDEELQKIAKKYEAMSDKICMSCGAPMYKSGIRIDSCINLCKDCLEERKSELREYNFYAVSDRNIYTYEDEEGYVALDITKDWEKYLAEYNQWKKHNTPSCPETEKVLEGI